MSIDAKLDAITKARSAYVLARATLEAKLRDQLKEELNNLQTQVDIAVRYAHDAGASKASILRAMGIKDYGTVKASLERTQGVQEMLGQDPLDLVYALEGNTLTAHYENHGPLAISGVARFNVLRSDDGTIFFMSIDPLWNDDYTIKNQVVSVLDNRSDGHYYEEALEWWKRSS